MGNYNNTIFNEEDNADEIGKPFPCTDKYNRPGWRATEDSSGECFVGESAYAKASALVDGAEPLMTAEDTIEEPEDDVEMKAMKWDKDRRDRDKEGPNTIRNADDVDLIGLEELPTGKGKQYDVKDEDFFPIQDDINITNGFRDGGVAIKIEKEVVDPEEELEELKQSIADDNSNDVSYDELKDLDIDGIMEILDKLGAGVLSSDDVEGMDGIEIEDEDEDEEDTLLTPEELSALPDDKLLKVKVKRATIK